MTDRGKMEDFAEMAFNCLISECDGVSCFNKDDAETVKNEVIWFIHNQPQIVRCKDCKYYRKNTRYPDTNLIMDYCAINAITGKDADWFCADGERKQNDALSEVRV